MTGAALPCAGNGSPHCQNVRRRCGIRSATPCRRGILPGKEKRIYPVRTAPRASGTLPAVYTVDLREELKCGNRSVFSRRLQELIQRRLAAKEQIILFLNKRGYAGFVSCRMCGHVLKCPHCDISLTEHKNGKMVCHYCGYDSRGLHGVRYAAQSIFQDSVPVHSR